MDPKKLSLKRIIASFNYHSGQKARALFRNKRERARLKNSDFTIFSHNCTGAIMYHDLGEQFVSPTINLFIAPKDFLCFMKDVRRYLAMPIEFIPSEETFPVGRIGEVVIRFVHYHSEEEARDAWARRTERINWDNVFVLCCDTGLTHEDMEEFDRLPFKNKILFMRSPDPSIRCGVYAKCLRKEEEGKILSFCDPFGKRYYQKYIDYVKWFNGEEYRL